MNQIFAAIAKAVLVTLVSTLAAIAVEQIRRYNNDPYEVDWRQSNDNDDHWQ